MASLPEQKSWQFHLIDKVDHLSSDWTNCCKEDVFFSPEFLSCIDDDCIPSVTQYYLEGRQSGELQLCLVLQVKHFELKDSLREFGPNGGILERWSGRVKSVLASAVRFNLLVVGNLLLTGQYGVAGTGPSEAVVELAVHAAKAQLRHNGVNVAGVLLKDYPADMSPTYPDLGYTKFSVQPSMYLHIDPTWNSLDDYMSAMKSKYRVRVRKALKLIEVVDKRILSLDDLTALQDKMNTLYRAVSDGASFNMFILPDDYFLKLKRALGDRVEIIGYFLEGELVGFYSAIYQHDHVDAHFLGYDPAVNQRLKLYFNMLLGLTSFAIDREKEGVMMSRTAMAIKSSVGAVPTDQFLYVKAFNGLINRLVDPVLHYFLPQEAWQQRHPFRR